MRSKLFVPASRPDLYSKAFASDADALSFDLEDSVAINLKEKSREDLHNLLRSERVASNRKTLIVRVNPVGSPQFEEDIKAVVHPSVDFINIPKPESAKEVMAAVSAIERAEVLCGSPRAVRILLNIETPKALRIASELAASHPRVAGLQLGLADLFEPLGVMRNHPDAVGHAMFALRMAAGEVGVLAYDAAFSAISDRAGFLAEAQLAHALGFIGKSCIHPSQVAIANEIFRPSKEQIAHAIRVVEAAEKAGNENVGAFVVDGRMVDRPFIDRAKSLIAEAVRIGLIHT